MQKTTMRSLEETSNAKSITQKNCGKTYPLNPKISAQRCFKNTQTTVYQQKKHSSINGSRCTGKKELKFKLMY